MAATESEGRKLENSSTWTFVVVCAVFIFISLIIIELIEKVEKRLTHGRKKSLLLALDKMKQELMLVGFISLLLTVGQYSVEEICVKTSWLNRFTPCEQFEGDGSKLSSYSPSYSPSNSPPPPPEVDDDKGEDGKSTRRLLQYIGYSFLEKAYSEVQVPKRKQLAEAVDSSSGPKCPEGKESIISSNGLQQLHILIFVLAVVHVVYSIIAMTLAMLKVRTWKKWEDEVLETTSTVTHDHDQNQHEVQEISKSEVLAHHPTFVSHHRSYSGNSLILWLACFFRQFGISVRKPDYLSLRLGFIKNHSTGRDFNFHSYMVRCMEDEFQRVVGIDFWLWAYMLAVLVLNMHGLNFLFWISFLPALTSIVIGAKLQHVIATLAIENDMAGYTYPQMSSRIKPRDELFWFSKPTLLLHLIHFILFHNAFELATVFWYLWQFGPKSCLLNNTTFLSVRIIVSVLSHILCSYSTLPLYALVTQMGSQYRHSIFHDNVKQKLRKWREGVKRKAKLNLGLIYEESLSPYSRDSEFHGVGSAVRSTVHVAEDERYILERFPRITDLSLSPSTPPVEGKRGIEIKRRSVSI